MRVVSRYVRIVLAVLVAGATLLAGSLLQACNGAKQGDNGNSATGKQGGAKDMPPPVICDPVHPGPPPAPDPNKQ